jgi:aminoglycoside N3'-acetyltransferase
MKKEDLNFKEYLQELGLILCDHIIVHSSFSKIKKAFPKITPDSVINFLKDVIGPAGSVIFPAFTYCYKKSVGRYDIFDLQNSKSKNGLLSETFRLSKDVIRTSSATHSFALWGEITNHLDTSNNPYSPLGKESVLEWLAKNSKSYVIMLGTDFSALTYGHYLEIETQVPWYNYSPWNYLNILPFGVSTTGEQKLNEIPGCSKNFINFEKYLLKNSLIKKHTFNDLNAYLIPIELLHQEGLKYFKENSEKLLCSENTCPACDSRRKKFLVA